MWGEGLKLKMKMGEKMNVKCDTCGKAVSEVERVVIYKNYDRTRAKPIYNCRECFEKKEKEKKKK